jgi:hypoxanthine phosphoribosyltransferase
MEELYNWDNFYKSCCQLTELIQANTQKQTPFRQYDLIIGIARGGLIPACIISHQLYDIPVMSIGVSSYNKDKTTHSQIIYQDISPTLLTNKKVLVVDDLVDSGCTLKTIKDYYCLSTNAIIHTAVLITKTKTKFLPDFSLKTTSHDIWITFPYEKSNT